MADTTFVNSIYSLLPPVIAIALAIITRHVLISLSLGIIVGVFLLSGLSVFGSFGLLIDKIQSLFWTEGAINAWNFYIIGFLLLLGVITTLISMSGSASAFADWARQRIKNRRQAEFLTIIFGIVIFIDDYFNSLVVGSVAQPVSDKFKVSRAKLAYLLDSTAAPVCVLMPLSSWGAYISALLAGLLIADNQQALSGFGVLTGLIPFNFYPIVALALLCSVAYWGLDVGPMRKEQQRANAGALYNHDSGSPPGINEELASNTHGSIAGLFLPVLSLILATLFFMVYTGMKAVNGQQEPVTWLLVMENLDLGFSLFYGALVSAGVALVFMLKHNLPASVVFKSVVAGIRSMAPAVTVLLFAWTIASVINDMETGKYLAGFALDNIPLFLLPVILFALTGFIAFSTGTSWGTFGIMLPIAIDMATASDSSMLLPMLAAVLSGAVFGDHCSPISDTTILSSTGAGCHHMDHVITQLPYSLMAAFIAASGFLVLGITHSLSLSAIVCSALFVVLVLFLKRRVAQY